MGCYDFFVCASGARTLLDDLASAMPIARGVYPFITGIQFKNLKCEPMVRDEETLTEKMVLNSRATASSSHASEAFEFGFELRERRRCAHGCRQLPSAAEGWVGGVRRRRASLGCALSCDTPKCA